MRETVKVQTSFRINPDTSGLFEHQIVDLITFSFLIPLIPQLSQVLRSGRSSCSEAQ